MKTSIYYGGLFAILFCWNFLPAQTTSKPSERPPVQFLLDLGISTYENVLFDNVPWRPDVGAMVGLNVWFPKAQLGLRYRKEFWYRLGRFRQEYEFIYNRVLSGRNPYQEFTTIEAYKKINLFPNKPTPNTLTLGGGYGWVYPFWKDRPMPILSPFVSYNLHWFELELRVDIKLKDPLGAVKLSTGWINLTAYYTISTK